jgi:glc operon protein GlcG
MTQRNENDMSMSYSNRFNLADARRVVAAAEQEAARHGWPMVIAVVDSGGHLVLQQRLDGAQLGSIHVARQKAETAVLFRRPTRVFEEAIAQGGLHLRGNSIDSRRCSGRRDRRVGHAFRPGRAGRSSRR